MSQKCKSNQEFDNCQVRIIFGNTREQLLAETKSEILRHEYRADLAENNICELTRREQAPLHEELADGERAIRDILIRSIQKLEELKRDWEFRLEEFSRRRRMVENHF